MEGSEIASVVGQLLNLLSGLEPDERRRVLQTAATFYEVPFSPSQAAAVPNLDRIEIPRPSSIPFSNREDITPKEFLMQKQPRTEPQRIACLAYYLSHYRDTAYFKTIDLAALNTEGAQPKISNIARAAFDALRAGYLAPAGTDKRQLSALGEQFVLALPDAAAAKLVMTQGTRQSRLRSPRAIRKPSKRFVQTATEK